VVVVTDHVNLIWRSPLAGPNDDDAGPRFPSMDSVYAPEAVLARGSAGDGMIVVCGVVAGTPDDRAVGEYESEMASRFGWAAVSSELVAPVIVAAHMGLRVAAVVLVR
jgi:purine nucleoside phosphorylase